MPGLTSSLVGGVGPRPSFRPRGRACLVAATLLAFAAPAAVTARPAGSAGDKAAKVSKKAKRQAKRYEKKGKKAYARGRWDDAIVAFELAHKANPQPRYLFNVGRCHERKGDLFTAMEYIQRYVAGVQDEAEQEDAQAVYEILRGKLLKTSGELRVRSEPTGANVLLTSREQEITGTSPMTRWVEAGTWKLAVSKYGYAPHAEEVPLAVGETLEVVAKLETKEAAAARAEAEAQAAAAAQATGPSAEEPASAERSSASPRGRGPGLTGMLVFGAAGAALVGGVTFAVLSGSAEARVDEMKTGAHEWAEIEDEHDAAKSHALISNVLLATGGVGVAAGVALWLLGGEESAAASWSPAPGGGVVTVRGAF